MVLKETSGRHLKSLDYGLSELKQIPQVQRIWVFGSVAKGKSDYGSDVDLIVHVSDCLSPRELRDIINGLYTQPELDTSSYYDYALQDFETH